MKLFSISEVEQLTSIKKHTLRIWERRFDFLKTERTESNIRYFTMEELAFLLDFSLLNRHGVQVSHLADLDHTALKQRINGHPSETVQYGRQVNRLILTLFLCDVEEFEAVLDFSLFSWGIDPTIDKVIRPFLERMELFCYRGHTSLEYHFAVTALRSKLIFGIEKTDAEVRQDRSVLLCLPKGEHYDLILLYLNYQLKKSGFRVLYLGTDITPENLEKAIDLKQPHYSLMYVSPIALKIGKVAIPDILQKEGNSFYVVSTKPAIENYQHFLPEKKLISYNEVVNKLTAQPQEKGQPQTVTQVCCRANTFK